MDRWMDEARQARHSRCIINKNGKTTHPGDFPAAIAAWTRALAVDSCPSSSSSSSSTTTTTPPLAALRSLKARCLANRAQAWLQLREHGAAERDCAASLELEPGTVKVVLRRATVRERDACLSNRPTERPIDRSMDYVHVRARVPHTYSPVHPGGKTTMQALLALERVEEARALLDTALTLRPAPSLVCMCATAFAFPPLPGASSHPHRTPFF